MTVPGMPIKLGKVKLRLVKESDASLIVALRNSEKGKILPKGAQTVADQVLWLQNYKIREQRGDEYYFAIEFDREPVGYLRVYAIDRSSAQFSWGSWVIVPQTPPVVSLSAVFLVYEFCFGALGLQQAVFDVRCRNLNVLRFHLQTGAKEISRNSLDVFFEYPRNSWQSYRPKILQLIQKLA